MPFGRACSVAFEALGTPCPPSGGGHLGGHLMNLSHVLTSRRHTSSGFDASFCIL